jgi:hypothetical protein
LIRLPVLAASNLWQKKYRHGFTDSRIGTDDYFRLIRLPVLAAKKNIATDSRIGTDDYFGLIRLPVLAASNL